VQNNAGVKESIQDEQNKKNEIALLLLSPTTSCIHGKPNPFDPYLTMDKGIHFHSDIIIRFF
jgi:hypothetical protein